MASLNLGNSWHTYTKEKVDELVATGKIGNYAFGYLKEGDTTYYVTYVSRSDTCLNARLKSHNHFGHAKCVFFKFLYASTKKEAYEKECTNYHDFTPGLNDIHPQLPEDLKHKCPKENCDSKNEVIKEKFVTIVCWKDEVEETAQA